MVAVVAVAAAAAALLPVPVPVPVPLPPSLVGLCPTLLCLLLLLLLPWVPLQHRQRPFQKDRPLPSCLRRLPQLLVRPAPLLLRKGGMKWRCRRLSPCWRSQSLL